MTSALTFRTSCSATAASASRWRRRSFTPWPQHGVRALAVLTVSDHILTHEALPADQRETSFGAMVEVALEAAFS